MIGREARLTVDVVDPEGETLAMGVTDFRQKGLGGKAAKGPS